MGGRSLAVTLCSRRERQEQLMGYRKRGPKPKPLVVQVKAMGSGSRGAALLSVGCIMQRSCAQHPGDALSSRRSPRAWGSVRPGGISRLLAPAGLCSQAAD